MLSERIDKLDHLDLEQLNVPLQVSVEASNYCNYQCFFCAQKGMTRERKNLDLTFGKKILSDLFSAGVREVGFTGNGEATLNPNLPEFVLYAKQLGYIYIYLTTNGNGASDELFLSLMKNGIDSLKFSINADNKEDYAKVHGVGLSAFDTVIDRVNMLDRYRKENNLQTKLYVSCVGDVDIEKIKKLLPGVDEVLAYPIHNHSSQIDNLSDYSGRESCNYPFYRSHITVEGYVKMCCADFQNFLIMGDLNKNSFMEIWNGPVYTMVRKKFLKNDYSGLLCAGCMSGKYTPAEPTMPEYASYPQLHIIPD